MVRFFLDTFAMFEIINGNPRYEKYINCDLSTSLQNLYELYYNLLKTNGEDFAKNCFKRFRQFAIQISDGHIFNASKFRLENLRLNLSYADALGYAMAKEEEMKFLTGDKAFKGMDNVEFVK
ncbi:MAG: PIN domain-containing protein [Candidatus Aenigmarchaeota archaeon]|nr:PIN domain-containing protein [Candidatus Aenigmarchaeota archaeon]